MGVSSSTVPLETIKNCLENPAEKQKNANIFKIQMDNENSESSFSLLLSMPKVVMNQVLAKLDFREIQVLRKVCRDLRNFIDDSRIFGTLSSVKILSYPNWITVVYDSKVEIIYRNRDIGCLVEYRKKSKLLRNEQYMDICLSDLNSIIGDGKAQKSLELFGFYQRDPCFLPHLHKSLSTRLRPLSTVTLLLEINESSEVLKLLPFMDSVKLKNIRIFDKSPFVGNFEIGEISKLQQWKSAEKVTIEHQMDGKDLQRFGHFMEVLLTLEVVKSQNLMDLKEMNSKPLKAENSKNENCSFLSMPDRPVYEIMEKLNFRDIQVLRKVCRDLRNFIDDSRLLGTLSTLKIVHNLKTITVVYDGKYSISYNSTITSNGLKGCLMDFHGKSKLFKNAGNLKFFMADLALILGPRRDAELQVLSIYPSGSESQNFFEEFQKILISRPRPFRVETFTIPASSPSQIMAILPYLDPYKLKNLRILNGGISGSFDIDEIVRLEQWKMAERVTVQPMISAKFLKEFSSFKDVLLMVEEVKTEDLVELKNTFLSSSTLDQFLFTYQKLNDAQNFLHRKNRYFKIESSASEGVVLSIRHNPTDKFINFRRIRFEEVPPHKIIED